MEDAFDRLTNIQKQNINKATFYVAYDIVSTHNQLINLKFAIFAEAERIQCTPADLLRYCRLVRSVM